MKMNLKAEGKNKLYFYGCLILGLFLSGSFIYQGILPGIKTLDSLKKELKQKKVELERRYNTALENKKLIKEIAETEKSYENFSRMLFPLADISNAVKEITNISQDLQIEFISLAPSPPAELARSSPEIGFYLWGTYVAIRMKTNYEKLLDFVKRIETSVKFIEIESFQVKKNPANLAVHDAQMTLLVYSLQQKKEK